MASEGPVTTPAQSPAGRNPEDLPYRRGVGVILFNAQGRVLAAQRRDMISEAWQMPQGGIDEGETPLQAAFRELGEEIGTDKAEFLAESSGWYRTSQLIASGRSWRLEIGV